MYNLLWRPVALRFPQQVRFCQRTTFSPNPRSLRPHPSPRSEIYDVDPFLDIALTPQRRQKKQVWVNSLHHSLSKEVNPSEKSKLYEQIIKGYHTLREYTTGIKTFETMHTNNLTPTPLTYCIMVWCYLKSGQHSKIPELHQEIENRKIEKTDALFSSLIRYYVCFTRDSDQFLKLYKEAKEKNLVTESLRNQIVPWLFHFGFDDEAKMVIEDAKKQNILPSSREYEIRLKIAVDENDHQRAQDIVSEMRQNNIKLDNQSYHALIQLSGKINDVASVYELLKEMEQNNIGWNSFTYGVLLSVWLKLEKWDEAVAVFEKAKENHIPMNSFLLTNGVAAYRAQGNIVKMCELLEEAKLKGEPTVPMYSMILRYYGQHGEIQKAEELFSDLLNSKFLKPTVETFNNLLKMYGSNRNREKMNQCLKMMKAHGISLDAQSYLTLLRSYDKREDHDRLSVIYDQYQRFLKKNNTKSRSQLRE